MTVFELKQNVVKPFLRGLLRPILPPGAFQSIRYGKWCLGSYFPSRVTGMVVKRMPQVRGFGPTPNESSLTRQLKNVNLLAPTRMCRIMTKYGSDKGRPNKYTPIYSELFKERSSQSLVLLELGLGTNNPDLPSNMGVFGIPGASLRGWRDLFPNAAIYGADIDRSILFEEPRIKTFYCDQLSSSSIGELWSHRELQGGADIIIDDGLHTLEANVSFLDDSLKHLRPGGIYIVEDILWGDIDDWYARYEAIYAKRYPDFEFAFVIISHPKHRGSNNLLVIRRRTERNS